MELQSENVESQVINLTSIDETFTVVVTVNFTVCHLQEALFILVKIDLNLNF